MGNRRVARESALQMLYQIEVAECSPKEAEGVFWSEEAFAPEIAAFANELVEGVINNRDHIDNVISSSSTNWKIGRMAIVDKNVLRMAIFEIENYPDIPAKVTLNEAIEIAKKYGSEDSGSFINGILDRIAKELRQSKKKKTG